MKRASFSSAKRKKVADGVSGALFVAPLCIGLGLFLAFPLIYALVISFTDYQMNAPELMKFVWFDNYIRAFQDEWFLSGLRNALINAIGVPIGMFCALLLSTFILRVKKGGALFKVLLYVPTVCSAVAITFIWQWMFQGEYGLLNRMLVAIGLPKVSFLNRHNFWGSMIFMGVWSGLGTSILLFYAQLKNIPNQLYEAAMVDGANAFQSFFHITIPGVSPVSFYILLTGIAGSFQDFTRFQVMTGDSMQEWNVMPVWYIYKFTSVDYGYRLGYASAMGIILGIILIVISLIQFFVSRYWVHYDS